MSDWSEYSKLVINKLEEFDNDIKDLRQKISELKIDIAIHNERIQRASGFWGAISGMVVAILTAIIINFVINDEPKVIYKEDTKVIIKKDEEN